jgi:class I fructose-bisphosphate aldolase
LLAHDGKCLDVAIDHGFFNESSFLSGIEDLREAVDVIASSMPDAIQLPPGTAPILQQRAGPKPSLVLRTDVANVYGKTLPRKLFSTMVEDPVEQALRLDAACVVVNLLLLPGEPELHQECVANICRIKPQCDRWEMPLMIEPLVMQPNETAGGYMVDGDIEKIRPLVRQAVELGADVIKADPCDDLSDYHHVVQVASGVPVLVRGGGRASDQDILNRTEAVMAQGASGIVYGRNIIQHPKPAAMTQALMSIVHDGVSAREAMRMI